MSPSTGILIILLFRGLKTMNEIRLSKSCIGEAEKIAVNRVLDLGFFGMGQEVKEFERELSNFFGKSATCVVNGTAALQLALEAVGVGPGDEVLVQSLTYVASFQAIRATGATPIACDVESTSLCLDLNDAKNKISIRTKAIMPVHYAGGVGDLNAIYDFAKVHGLRVIEDAAHAFGTTYNSKKVGAVGDICCFSFDGIKNITSGEGGCIVTSDQNIVSKLRNSRLLGVEGDTENRFSGGRTWDPDVKMQGWRYHMSDLMAAIGRVQLANFDNHRSKRQQLAQNYVHHLKSVPYISVFEHDYNNVVPHIFVVKLDVGIDREVLRQYLSENGVPTGIHYKPNHLLTYFSRKNQGKFPVTDKLYPALLTLPLHPDLAEVDVKYIVKVLAQGLSDAK